MGAIKLDINQIKTLYSTYRVLYQRKVMLGGKEKEGTINFSKRLFKISTRNSLLDQLETIVHEYYHSVFNELEIDSPEESEINLLSRALVKFIRENQELIKFIIEYKGEDNAKV